MVALGPLELTGRDRAEIADDVGEVHAVRPRVGALALLLGDDGRVVLRLLQDPQGDGLPDVGGHRHRLVGRAVPGGQRVLDLPPRGGDRVCEPAQRHGALAVGQPGQQGAVDGDLPGGAVGHQRPALVVDDEPALRLDHHLTQRLGRRRLPVGVARDDLEVVKPREQGGEEREDEHADDDQAQPRALGARPAGSGAARGGGSHRALAGSSRVSRRISARQHQRGERDVPQQGHEHDAGQDTRAAHRVREHQTGQGVDRRADEGRRRDRGHDRAERDAGVLSHQPGDVPDDHQGQRPASGDVVGGRGEVEHQAGEEAQGGGERRPLHQGGRDHHQQAQVGDDPLPGEVGEDRDLQHERDQHEAGGDGAPQRPHRRLPSARMTPRSLCVPDGTTTPTRSRAPKST